MGIDVCLATEKDREQLLDWFKHYKDSSLIEHRVDCYLAHNFTVVAKDNSKIVGILQYYVKENPRNGVAEFEEVHVLRNYRRRGIGSLLVKYAVDSVKSFFAKFGIRARRICLIVDEDNVAARGLYEKFGFVNIAGIQDVFHDGENELFYVLKL